MSEIPQPQPERMRRSLHNRTEESVNRSIGRIVEKLSARAGKLPEGNFEVEQAQPNHGIDGLRYSEWKKDGTKNDLEARRWKGGPDGETRSTELNVMRSYHKDNDLVSVSLNTRPNGTTAQFAPSGVSDSKYVHNPAIVADVAANILGQMRGRVAEAELDTKQKAEEADRILGEQMINFVNGKEDKK